MSEFSIGYVVSFADGPKDGIGEEMEVVGTSFSGRHLNYILRDLSRPHVKIKCLGRELVLIRRQR